MVSTEEALKLLEEPHWFGFRLNLNQEDERLYFVNVENLREG